MKSVIQKIITALAQAIIKKYKPDIIGVTGSVGKTSAKDAIVCALVGNFIVRGSEKTYNNEFGVPLTVIGMQSAVGSIAGWIRVIMHALRLLLWRDRSYPAILVIEMGADKPGDIEKLVSIAPPKIGVITAISPAHTDKLGALADVLEEKGKIFCRHSTADHWMVLSADEPLLRALSQNTAACVMMFGVSVDAHVQAQDITLRLVFRNDQPYAGGLFCTIAVGNESVPAEFPHIIGVHVLSSVLSAVAVGRIYHIPLQKIIDQLAVYTSPRSRMCPIPGIKGTLIIDDTYNSSPKAAQGALDVLSSFEIDEHARRIAVLGDMRELGEISEREHKAIGVYAAEKNIDMLICVGDFAELFAAGARDAGLDESRIFVFNDAQSAGFFLQNELATGDVVLVKGSQAVRLEKIVKEVMADPLHASELLVRQEEEWQK